MSPFRWLEARVPPLAVTALFALAMWGATVVWPSWSFAWSPRPGFSIVTRAIAVVLVVAGLAIGAAGIAAFRRRRTSVNPLRPEAASEVVSDGVYGYTRNPMYLGLALVIAGGAVWLAHAAAFVLAATYVAYLDRFQIVPEERALRSKFGPAFEAYTARVRRWI